MPRIPSYDQLQVAPTSNPGVRAEAPEFRNAAGAQMQEAGQAMQRVGGVAGQIAADIQNKANKVRIDDATNQLIKLDTDLSIEAQQIRGRNALERPDGVGLPDEYVKKMEDAAAEIEKGLGNDAQREAFRQVKGQVSTRFYGRIAGHMVKQQGVVEEETWNTTIATAQERGMLLYGDETERQASLGAIRATVDEMASKRGLDQASKDRLYTEHASPMHAGIIQSLILGDNPEAAKEYYEANSAEMTMQHRANVQKDIVSSTADKLGESAVSEVWQASGPQDAHDAVNLFDMDKQLREVLKDQPAALKRAQADLRERATLFNQQQAEQTAAGVNDVYSMIDSGASMSVIRRSEAWLRLPAKMRDQIQDDQRNDSYTDLQKSVAMQTLREKQFLRNSDEYLTLSSPDVLNRMSRGQVEALRPVFGSDATQKLLGKWDALKKPGAMGEAKMDATDFNALSREFGLDPLSKNKGEKERLGDLKFRMDILLERQQAEAGRKLTREERVDVMRKELAKTVTVEQGWGRRDLEVPVINLGYDKIEDVAVPQADRSAISEKMRTRYQKTQDPRFAPTEENLRYWYLRSKSPAADLIKPKAE